MTTTTRPMTTVRVIEDCPWGKAGDVREVPADWVPEIAVETPAGPPAVVEAPAEPITVTY